MKLRRAVEILVIESVFGASKKDTIDGLRSQVLRKFKEKVRETHPDAGGKGGDMAELKWARDTLLAYVEEKAKVKPCPHCDGTGRKRLGNGRTVKCFHCGGTGETYEQ